MVGEDRAGCFEEATMGRIHRGQGSQDPLRPNRRCPITFRQAQRTPNHLVSMLPSVNISDFIKALVTMSSGLIKTVNPAIRMVRTNTPGLHSLARAIRADDQTE